MSNRKVLTLIDARVRRYILSVELRIARLFTVIVGKLVFSCPVSLHEGTGEALRPYGSGLLSCWLLPHRDSPGR